ncbi:hypothetical protein [Microcoleus sp. CAWBG58]|uniref:hypothetical protein n=1 Tax=Microcoleus sp. CAWBG58 TaxID=2841651 RepID=UPI0025F967A7|nr:hypothetical protein [Microcoleus sp. CAWBG58]
MVSNGSRIELEVSNQKLAWNNHKELQNSLKSPYLYATASQVDATGSVNSSIYASFNRVIRGRSDRLGSGVSKVTILFDPIDYSITSNAVAMAEGNAGNTPVTFTITRKGTTSWASSVDYAIGGSAIDNSNYNNLGANYPATELAGTIDFAAGEISKTLTLYVVGDTRFEPNETIAVALSNPVAPFSSYITTAIATTTIDNDDSLLANVNVYYAIAAVGLAVVILSIAKLRSMT